MKGYTATLDGVRIMVSQSAEGLVSVPVPAGRHDLTFVFNAPLGLASAYWLDVSAWALVLSGAAVLVLDPKNLSAPFR